MGKIRQFLMVAFALFLPALGMSGQVSPRPAAPAFDVASVKPNKSGEQRLRLDVQPGGRFTAVNITLRELVAVTYPNPDGKFRNETTLVGGPPWFSSDRFDVVARAEGVGALDTNRPAETATPDDEAAVERIRAMMRNLMADRFKLALHHETRELPIYALVMARADRALGPQLRRSDVDCAALWKSGRAGGPLKPNEAPCGGFRMFAPGRVAGQAVSMGILADSLRGWAGRPVVDRTGLDGKADVTLNWTPEESLQGALDAAPSIFTAVQEQLGLKLEAERAPVDVLVVDHAEPPSPD